MAKLAEIRCFYRNLVRTVFVSFACVLSAISFGYVAEAFECTRIVLGAPVENQGQYDGIVNWGGVGDPATNVESSRIPGTVSYEGMCSMTPGQPGDIGNPEPAAGGGKYCWCRVNGFAPDDGQPRSLTGYPWVFMVETECKRNNECAKLCGEYNFWMSQLEPEDIKRCQQALYTTYDPKCEYKLEYDCNDSVAFGNNPTPDAQDVGFYQTFATHSPSVCPSHSSGLVLAGWDWTPQLNLPDVHQCPSDLDVSTSYLYPYHEDKTLYARWCEMRNLCPNGGVWDLVYAMEMNNSLDYSVAYVGGMLLDSGSSPEHPTYVNDEYECWCKYYLYSEGVPVGNAGWFLYGSDMFTSSADCKNACEKRGLRDKDFLCKYRVKYDCGGGTNNATPTVPASGSEYFSGAQVNLSTSVSGCPVSQDKVFVGWVCSADTNTNTPLTQFGHSFTMPNDFVTCTAQWEEPCGEDGTLLGTEILGELGAGDDYVNWGFYDEGPSQVPDGNGNFLGDVEYEGICSDPAGIPGMTGTPTFEGNAGCWCQVTGFTPAGWSEAQSLNGYPWVYVGGMCSEDSQCDALCKDKNMWKQNRDILGILQRNLYTRYICEYNLTYNCNNNVSNQSNIPGGAYAGGDSVLLWTGSGSCTIPSNSVFNGWVCNSGGSPVSVNGNQITMPSGNVTCTAQWIPRYTVTYYGGTCNTAASPIQENVLSGARYNVKNPSCQNSVLAGLLPGLPSSCRSFVGWATTFGGDVVYGSCDSTDCTCGDSVTISGNMNLYAVCENVSYNVIYHGGNCGDNLTYTDEDALTYGMNPEYSVLSVERMGWSGIPTSQFQGWSASSDLSGICATQSSELYSLLMGGHTEISSLGYSPVDECSNVDLYAVCCPLNLNWDLDGGDWSGEANQTTCDYGTGNITPLYTPIKTGYTFDGWKVTGYSTP